jgi:23S rRNA pseudouridine955/2504/2580 synthase
MSKVRHIAVTEDEDGQRLDRWLKKKIPDVPYGLLQKLIRKGQLRVDGKRAKGETKLVAGQNVRIPPVGTTGMKKDKQGNLAPKGADFIRSLVIYDDGDIIALNKPAGLAVQGGSGTRHHVDGMLGALTNKKGVKPRLVHRLDKDTSGVLLLARSAKVARVLGDMFSGRDIKKIYWAVVTPTPEAQQGTIRAAILKSSRGGKEKERMVVDEKEGKKAVTEYTVLENVGEKAAWVAFWPRTGRTHQIRVHAELMGSPIVGDPKYGLENKAEGAIESLKNAGRLHLHAARIICPHPVKKGKLDIQAPLPPELVKSWKALGFATTHKQDPFADLKN